MSDFKFKKVDLSERKATLTYFSWLEIFRELDGDSCKRLVTAILEYSRSGGQAEPDFTDSMVLRIVWAQIRQQIRSDLVNYITQSLKNQINIRVRWNRSRHKPEYDGIEDYNIDKDDLKILLKEMAENYLATGDYTTVYDRIDSNRSVYDGTSPYTTITDKDKGIGISIGTEKENGEYVGKCVGNDNGKDASADACPEESTEGTPDQTDITDGISLDGYFHDRIPTKDELEKCFRAEVFGDDDFFESDNEADKFLKKNGEAWHWKSLKNHTAGQVVANWIRNDVALHAKWETNVKKRMEREKAEREERQAEVEQAKKCIAEFESKPQFAELAKIIREYIITIRGVAKDTDDFELALASEFDKNDDEREPEILNNVRWYKSEVWSEDSDRSIKLQCEYSHDEKFADFLRAVKEIRGNVDDDTISEELSRVAYNCETLPEAIERLRNNPPEEQRKAEEQQCQYYDYDNGEYELDSLPFV